MKTFIFRDNETPRRKCVIVQKLPFAGSDVLKLQRDEMQTERRYPYRSAGSFFPALTFRETHERALDDM